MKYEYKPALFFFLTFLCTWIFWIPATFVDETLGSVLMLFGLFAPATVSILMVAFSKSDILKSDFKSRLVGFYKVNVSNLLIAIVLFAVIIVASIVLSLAFGESMSQFAFTEDFSFTGVGIAGALLTITLASIIEEVGWKGYCEDSLGNYMNWFMASLIFGILWSLWHVPLLFIDGTYQAGLMDLGLIHVVNFIISGIPLGFIITWVYLRSNRSILACMIFHLFVNFMQEKIAMTATTKCVETLVVAIAVVIIVLMEKELFFSEDHIGKLPQV